MREEVLYMCVLPDLMQAASAKATRKQEKVLLPKSLFVPDDQVCGCGWWRFCLLLVLF